MPQSARLETLANKTVCVVQATDFRPSAYGAHAHDRKGP